MMNEILDKTLTWFKIYFAEGDLFVIYVISIGIGILLKIRRKEKISVLNFVSILSMLILFFPPFAFVLQKIALEDVYWRMFWLLLIPLVIAITVVEGISGIKKYQNKVIFLSGIIAIIILGGKNIYTKENFFFNENKYKIPQKVVEVCDILMTSGEKHIKIIAPDEIMIWSRTYNSDIQLLYGRDYIYGFIDGPDEIYNGVNAEVWDVPFMVESAIFNDCNFIVQPLGRASQEEFEYYGFKKIGHTAEYVIYEDTMER